MTHSNPTLTTTGAPVAEAVGAEPNLPAAAEDVGPLPVFDRRHYGRAAMRAACARPIGRGLPTALMAIACAAFMCACGGSDAPIGDAAIASGHDMPLRASTDDPDWAPGETPTIPATAIATVATTPATKPLSELWTADGRARTTLPEDWPADPAARWSGQRYATWAQIDQELAIASAYTLLLDADDANAIETALQYAEAVHTFAGGKTLLGVFVRSRQPALAARLAERLTVEQGWNNVFVVI